VDRTEITIGDQVNYTLRIEYDTGIEIQKPQWGEGLEGFQILDFERGEPTTVNNRQEIVDKYILSTFTPEDYVIPPLRVPIKLPSGVTQELTTQPISIKVKSILPEDEKEYDLKDIKNPVPVYSGIFKERLILLIVAVILLVIMIFAIWWWRKGREQIQVRSEPAKPEHEIALYRLELLRTQVLQWEDQPPQELCRTYGLDLSEILREYLEKRYQFNALEMTTEELHQYFKRNLFLYNQLPTTRVKDIEGRIFNLLDATDLLKFARGIQSRNALLDNLDSCTEVVDSTRRITLTTDEVEIEEASDTMEITERREVA
jgi:hypothetical protein